MPPGQPLLQVWCEDCSGNGTLINQTVLLRKGQKRPIYSGDEITLVNSHTLKKKVRSHQLLQRLTQQQSFVFVLHQNPLPSLHTLVVQRAAAVNARATNQTAATTSRTSPAPPVLRGRVEHDYDIRELLGSGTVGQVHRAIHRVTGHERAIKIISTRRGNGHPSLHTHAVVQAEAALLQKLSHPYIVQLYDVYVQQQPAQTNTKNNSGSVVHLVMELLSGGDLFDRIVEKGCYSETESRRVMRRLLAAIHFLHCTANIGTWIVVGVLACEPALDRYTTLLTHIILSVLYHVITRRPVQSTAI
jgi:hypothetical protein